MTPAFPKKINEHREIRDSFQTNMDMEPIYSSSAEAEKSAELSERAVSAAQKAVRKAGMHSVDRICATGKDEQFILMGMQSTRSKDPGPRIFGFKTSTKVTPEDMDRFLRDLI